MTQSAQEVLHELTAAGLLSSDHATTYGAEIETGTEVLLTKLVADGHITEFQATKFREGKASDIYFGDYVVVDKLGQGGMGTVLLARHRRMERQVAIKILPVTVLESKDAVARFYQEVKVAAQLTHPNIVVAYDAGEHHGFHYLVMEYVPGHDLAEVLAQLGPIPTPMALDYIAQAAKGLEYAHRKGVVHRDIKPSNLLLNDEGIIKILDMGLARVGSSINQEVTQLTTTGQVMGTVEYMSPEQAEDTRQADIRSDIYSLGCTLYRLLTGRSPFSRDTVVKTILAHRGDPIPEITTGLPDEDLVNQLFQKMVAKKPEDRFQTVSALIDAIDRVSQGDSLAGPTAPMPTPNIDSPPALPGSPARPVNPYQLRPPASSATALVERFDSRGEAQSLPEAIIDHPPRGSSGPVEYITEDSLPAIPPRPSEVIYIPDIVAPDPPARGIIRRAFQLWRKERSIRIAAWSVLSVIISSIPVLGLLIALWTLWGARHHLKKINSGRQQSQYPWLSTVGKYVSMFAAVLGLIFTILAISGVHPFVN